MVPPRSVSFEHAAQSAGTSDKARKLLGNHPTLAQIHLMATLNISQDDAVRGFRAASDLNNTFGGIPNAGGAGGQASPLANLKHYVLGTGNPVLPTSYKDAAHTSAGTPGSDTSAPFMSWPTWATLNTQVTPWYEYLGLTRMQRYVAFALCIAASTLLLFIAFFRMPLSVVFPGKFVLPLCLANLFLFTSFGFLHGFGSYAKHLVSRDRWPFTALFFGSTMATLYVAYFIQFYPVTLVFTLVQMAASLSYVVSYVPGGSTGLSFIGSTIKSKFTGGF